MKADSEFSGGEIRISDPNTISVSSGDVVRSCESPDRRSPRINSSEILKVPRGGMGQVLLLDAHQIDRVIGILNVYQAIIGRHIKNSRRKISIWIGGQLHVGGNPLVRASQRVRDGDQAHPQKIEDSFGRLCHRKGIDSFIDQYSIS